MIGGCLERLDYLFKLSLFDKCVVDQLGLIGPRLTFVELFSLGTVQFVYRMFFTARQQIDRCQNF